MSRRKGVRLGAIVMAATLMLSFGTPVMAAAPSGAATEVKTVTVMNVDGAASVKAYRIVEPTFDSVTHHLTGYKVSEGVEDYLDYGDIEAPEAETITNIVKDIKSGDLSLTNMDLTLADDGKSASGDLPAGEWVIIVTDGDNSQYIYNPMLVSVQYDDANDLGTNNANMTAKGVDATGTYNIPENGMYAKRSSIPFDKTIVSPDSQYAADNDITDISVSGADDLQVGDTGHFMLYSRIPEYSEAYTEVTYEISDTQDAGFDAPTNITIIVDGQTVTQGDSTAQATVTGNDFKVVFASDFVLDHTGKDVKITYDAVLNSSATMQFSPNVNSATLKYTNDLDEHFGEKVDSVKEYTFKLDGELIKVKKDNSASVDGYVPLAGATFTLTRTSPNPLDADHVAPAVATCTTDADGKIKFDCLDEGTYTLQETAAPTGYSVNDTVYTVTITPTYSGTGKDAVLSSYTVTVSYTDAEGTKTSTFEYDGDPSDAGTAGKEAATTTTTKEGTTVISATNAVEVVDVVLADLPATGAQGTVAFAVIGAVGMALIAVLIAKKKREESAGQQ